MYRLSVRQEGYKLEDQPPGFIMFWVIGRECLESRYPQMPSNIGIGNAESFDKFHSLLETTIRTYHMAHMLYTSGRPEVIGLTIDNGIFIIFGRAPDRRGTGWPRL